MRRSLRSLPVLLVLVLAASAGADEEKKLPVLRKWTGKIADEKKQKQSPESGVIADAKVFATVWTAWRPDEEVPKVDFDKELVLIATAMGPNTVEMIPQLDEKGDLKVLLRATLIGGPGFGYTIGVVPRDGIKTVKGKPLVEK